MYKNRNTHLKNLILIICVVLFSCMGCGEVESEEETIIADVSEEASTFAMVECARDRVELVEKRDCSYIQSEEQTVELEFGGKRITRVLVREGDVVSSGDILLELENDNLEERIENLSFKIKNAENNLSHLGKQEEFGKADTYFGYVFGSGLETEDDLIALEKSMAGVEKNYRYQREDLEDEIEFDKKELARLQNELTQSRVYATINGLVYDVEDNLQGATAQKGQTIMTIVDESTGYFSSSDEEIYNAVTEDMILSLSITYGEASGSYELKPSRFGEWTKEEQFFDIVSMPEEAILSVGIKGYLYIPIEVKDSVLALPNVCVHTAGDERYVYVLDENGMKAVRYVEIGLEGNDMTEIISGLSEGEMVVRK